MLQTLGAAVNRGTTRLASLIDGFGIAMLVTSAGLTFVSVVLRYGFGWSHQLLEETARYTIVYACILYVGPCMQRGQHIAVDLISSHMPDPVKRAWQFALNLLFLVVVLFVFVAGWIWVSDLYGYQMTVMGGTMPAWLPSMAVPIGMGVAVLFGISGVLISLLALISPPPDGPAIAAPANAVN
ncbi:MAG: TRAP transporter small permease [Burkholderiaceae bacterium]|nr:TRAP transporter small permease [Burkholderiaceae bacterium]